MAPDCTANPDVLRNALHAMGWNLDSQMPMADAANMALVQEMENIIAERAFLISTGQEMDRRRDALVAHRKHAVGMTACNDKLIQAYKVEEMKEINALKVVRREVVKSKVDQKTLDKDITEMEGRLKKIKADMDKRKANINKLTNCVKWVKTALLDWEAAMESGNRGYQLVEKYFKDDQIMAQQRERQRQLLQNTIDQTRKQLVLMYDERQVLELSLDGIAKLYRQASEERRTMVETWKGAVTLMTTREDDIHRMEAELVTLKQQCQEVDEELKANDNQLNEIQDNNREIEVAIEEINSDCSDLKGQMDMVIDMIRTKEKEVEQIRKEIQNLSNFLELKRAENRKKKKEKRNQLKELKNYDELIGNLLDSYDALKNKNMTAQERLKIVEDMHKAEDAAMAVMNKEGVRINGMIYRAETQRTNLKSEVKTKKAENDSIRVNQQATEKSMRRTEKALKQQTEVHYETGFKYLEIERAIVHLQGGVLDPEVEQRNRTLLVEMEEQNQLVSKRLKAIEAQNKKLDDEMRKLTDVFNSDTEKLLKINDRIREAQIYFEGGVKQLKTEKIKSQSLLVEYSILKMRVDEFEKEIQMCNNTAYNLATHRAHLDRTMSTRMIEIKSQMELLQLKRKHLNEEKSTLRADVGERNKHIDAVRSRFALSIRLLGTNEDGTPVTATQLRAEAAMEKQALMLQGNELNREVLVAESELRAMENTLSYINHANDQFKKSFVAATEDTLEEEAYVQLTDAYKDHLNVLKVTRQAICEIEEDISKKKELIHRLEEKLALEERKRDELHEHLRVRESELLGQLEKIERAERENLKYRRLVRKRHFTEEFLLLFERDLNLTDMENRNLKALNLLVDVAQTKQAYGQQIKKLLLQRGITMPYFLKHTSGSTSWHSKLSDFSNQSSKNLSLSSTRSSSTEGGSSSDVRTEATSAVFNVVSIDFPEVKATKSKDKMK